MTDTSSNRLATRLRRLPGELLLALINGTAVLVIIAAVLVLVAAARIDHFANRITTTMTDAVLTRLDVEPERILTELNRLSTEVSELTDTLRAASAAGNTAFDRQVANLEQQAAALRASIDRLSGARSDLVDEAISAFAQSTAESLKGLRKCPTPPEAGVS
jgi:HAMP domain-containing protein